MLGGTCNFSLVTWVTCVALNQPDNGFNTNEVGPREQGANGSHEFIVDIVTMNLDKGIHISWEKYTWWHSHIVPTCHYTVSRKMDFVYNLVSIKCYRHTNSIVLMIRHAYSGIRKHDTNSRQSKSIWFSMARPWHCRFFDNMNSRTTFLCWSIMGCGVYIQGLHWPFSTSFITVL